jgi:hypothetical protein
LTPRPTLRERLHSAVERMGERPGPVVLALAIGVLAGLGVRGVASSDETSPSPPEPIGRVARAAPEPPRREAKPAPKPATATAPDMADRVSAAVSAIRSYAAGQGDVRVGAAIVPLDGSLAPTFAGTVSAGRPWSVMKVPTAAAYLNFKRERGGAVSGEATIPPGSPERESLGSALVQSDNIAIRHRVQEMIAADGPAATASAINAMLIAGGAQPQVSAAIDPSIDSLQIGTGEWALDEAATWFRHLQVGSGQCLGLAQDDRVFLLRQLRAAPEALHWGAAASLDNSEIALKPGWGSYGSLYTVEQAVIVGNGSEEDGFPSLRGGYVMVLMAVLPSSDASALTEGQQRLAELAELIDQKMGSPGPQEDPSAASAC